MPRAPRFAFAVSAALALAFAMVPPSVARADEPPAAGPSVEDISAKVQAFYNQTKTFQAQFNQVYKVKLHQRTKKSSGRVTFEKPGKMHWQYDENGNRVVSDGKTLKVYEKENGQMFEQPVEKSQYPAALSFLMGQGDLAKSFNLKQLDSATMKFEGGYVLEGTPKDATPAYQKVIFYIDRETSQVRRVIILDAQGNRNEFTFKSPSVNKDLPKDVFEFTPPSGTQIVHPELGARRFPPIRGRCRRCLLAGASSASQSAALASTPSRGKPLGRLLSRSFEEPAGAAESGRATRRVSRA